MKNYSGFKTLKTVHRKEISYSYFGCSFSDGQQISKAHHCIVKLIYKNFIKVGVKKMRKSVLGLIIIVIILAGIGIYYYNNTVSAGRFNNGDISFEYPSNFTLSESPVGGES